MCRCYCQAGSLQCNFLFYKLKEMRYTTGSITADGGTCVPVDVRVMASAAKVHTDVIEQYGKSFN